MVDTRTQLLGVIGDPIEHSLSPLLHNYILNRLNLNFCYHAFQVKTKNLERSLDAFQLMGLKGINVTIPHKEAVFQRMHHVSKVAKQIQAVNTVLFRDGQRWGFNTDGTGFTRSLGEFVKRLPGAKVLVLGAGGSAKAVISALIRQKAGEIGLFNRTCSKAELLCSHFQEVTGYQNIYPRRFDSQILADEISESALIVNTTPVGMYPQTQASPIDAQITFPEKILAYDLIYNPQQTQFLHIAEQAGALTFNGLDMLIYQGVAALEIWLEQKIDITPFFIDLRSFLRRQLKSI